MNTELVEDSFNDDFNFDGHDDDVCEVCDMPLLDCKCFDGDEEELH